MLFNSAIFLFGFLPITLASYYLILGFAPKAWGKLPSQLWLFLASLFFYGWWNPVYVTLILASLLFNYYLGRYLMVRPDRKTLFFGIGANLAVLLYYKYTGFLMGSLDGLTGWQLAVPQIVLPLGISFFTFQKIAFLVDCHRREAQPNQSLINFGLFITFFPQLIAGPIVHHKEMMPQFARPKPFDAYTLAAGLSLLALGLFKKVMIADTLEAYASPLFHAAETRHLHIAEAWVAVLCYTFQIYFDFSGYSDMALGLGKMFGVRLPVNFFSPYKADNIIDFWRRWHMTLSRFLRDYLYIPLGGNRKGPKRRYVNLLLTMLLGGLWHGANWTFAIWGALHGVFLALNHFWREGRNEKNAAPAGRVYAAAARLLTFLCVMTAWVFFRAPNAGVAFSMLSSLIDVKTMTGSLYETFWSSKSPLRQDFGAHMTTLAPALIAGCALLCWGFPNSIEIMRKARPCISGVRGMKLARGKTGRLLWSADLASGIAFGALLAAALLRVIYEPSQVFLYFQF